MIRQGGSLGCGGVRPTRSAVAAMSVAVAARSAGATRLITAFAQPGGRVTRRQASWTISVCRTTAAAGVLAWPSALSAVLSWLARPAGSRPIAGTRAGVVLVGAGVVLVGEGRTRVGTVLPGDGRDRDGAPVRCGVLPPLDCAAGGLAAVHPAIRPAATAHPAASRISLPTSGGCTAITPVNLSRSASAGQRHS